MLKKGGICGCVDPVGTCAPCALHDDVHFTLLVATAVAIVVVVVIVNGSLVAPCFRVSWCKYKYCVPVVLLRLRSHSSAFFVCFLFVSASIRLLSYIAAMSGNIGTIWI